MLTYDLKVGYSCNNRCKHCVIEDSKDKLAGQHVTIDLTTQECLKQIEFAAQKGTKFIVLTGGEVTIRKDFAILMKKCAEYNFDVTIQTNGRRLYVEDVSNPICNYGKVRCLVALHGSKDVTHDSITQVKGSFQDTCKGIEHMVSSNVLIVLKVVISKINMSELTEIVELASELGVKHICFAFPHGQGGARKNFDEVIPTYSELKPILKDVIEKAKSKRINIEFEAVPFCIIPYAMQLVGELKYLTGNTLCTQVKEETFDWEKVRKSIKSKSERCHKCDMDELCEGVWCEYAETFGMDELTPILLPQSVKEKIISRLKK